MGTAKRVRWFLTTGTFTLGLAVAVVFAYYLGSWLDARFASGSTFSSILVLAAIAGAFYNLYRHVRGPW
ncbi:MAG TPA: AtpZ/AtpI family protein [Firmicutes bacterium]|nr:AtpZ/AtpI family protein [Bacillota bacterium]